MLIEVFLWEKIKKLSKFNDIINHLFISFHLWKKIKVIIQSYSFISNITFKMEIMDIY